MINNDNAADKATANAFATSWNNLKREPIYTEDQFIDWFGPLTIDDISGKAILELGCGNASLMFYVAKWRPKKLTGIDLGDSVESAKEIMAGSGFSAWRIEKGDLVSYKSEGYDVVYCIGVLHHLKDPRSGFYSVLRNTKPGGRFHCWVYAREGNTIIIHIVDPLRRLASRLPWWFTKYFLAVPLVMPFYVYSKLLSRLPRIAWLKNLPLYEYSLWISRRGFGFYRHVAFDQLVTPQTTYLSKQTIEGWLNDKTIDSASRYLIMRNGNSWKFGGKKNVE